MKLDKELQAKVSELLGGKNVTAKRMAELLEELKQHREGSIVADLKVDDYPADEIAGKILHFKEGQPGKIIELRPPSPDPERLSQFRKAYDDATRDGDDGPEKVVVIDDFARGRIPEDLDPHTAANEPAAEMDPDDVKPGAAVPADPKDRLIQSLEMTNKLLMNTVKSFESKLDDLMAKKKVGDLADAKEQGLLPPEVQGPPLGFTGPASWPIGEWFTSPLGPKGIQIKICQCCGRGTQHHWYCVICHRGPFHYPSNCKVHGDPPYGPFFTKGWTAPGGIWGLAHNVCGKVCHDQYLGMIGVMPGVNDMTPPGMPGRPDVGNPNAEPVRPARAIMSD